MDKIGKYVIEAPLLETGFSDIYIARDPECEGYFALKVFHPKGNNIGENAKYGEDFWRARFVDEAGIMARFEHPHLIRVVDVGETEDGDPYFVMPFMQANLLFEIGEDAETPEEIEKLDRKWRPRALSPRRAVEIWRQMLDGLSALHEAGLVHRDIKPPNVLLDSKKQGRVKLCDFGMVKVPGAVGSRSGIWVGTLEYISPEQRKSATEVDVRSDVYSAGVVMYRMLSGRLPKQGRAPMRAGRFGIPQGLVDLIENCLQHRRRDRPSDAREVLQKLEEFVSDIQALPERSRIPLRTARIKVISKTS
ncbi:serine/threonine-protein kinase [Thalassospiraceae bacterium LMO-JJ14]|nr:serine/threonine-protein kinase [Thalassospiraceae bacterium LMO-JJ14]